MTTSPTSTTAQTNPEIIHKGLPQAIFRHWVHVREEDTKAYEVWSKTPHAHATDSLVKPPNSRGNIARHFDPECLSCHVTGWDPQQLIGQRMTIWTSSGPLPAVIARKAIHLLNDEERKQAVKQQDLWLDIGARSKAEASELVRIGDPVTLQLGFQAMRNQLAKPCVFISPRE